MNRAKANTLFAAMLFAAFAAGLIAGGFEFPSMVDQSDYLTSYEQSKELRRIHVESVRQMLGDEIEILKSENRDLRLQIQELTPTRKAPLSAERESKPSESIALD